MNRPLAIKPVTKTLQSIFPKLRATFSLSKIVLTRVRFLLSATAWLSPLTVSAVISASKREKKHTKWIGFVMKERTSACTTTAAVTVDAHARTRMDP